MKSTTNPESDIAHILGIDKASSKKKRLRKWLIVVLLAIGALITIAIWRGSNKADSMQYKTQEVQRGDLTVTISATGSLEPTNQVDVGSELSGIIESVEVDYNDEVKAGQVLARLDTEKLQAQVLQSKAALESAKAQVLLAQATIVQASNDLERLKCVSKLSNQKVPSQQELDTAGTSLKRAQASETSAQAQVLEAQARLDADQTDLAKTVIRSPINGIVLTRNVESGQTVAASLQAPVLFVLAEDLTQMELHVAVDEADVGQVKRGQDAIFTVDAYPDKKFPARITQVRYASQTVEGVVTYETVLNVDNSDLLLRPGMTATADIIVKKVKNAILIPNAALRFTPPVQQNDTSGGGSSLVRFLLPRHPRRNPPTKERQNKTANSYQKRVWQLKEGIPVPLSVTTGASDGQMTEVVAGEVKPGLPLIVDVMGTG